METVVLKRSIEEEVKIEQIKVEFEQRLKSYLSLTKVNAPLFLPKSSGLNDDLNGVERPVSFQLNEEEYQVVHSLAKWKRWYLGELGVIPGKGLVTDMKAIRADEILSPIHSHLVDQWDWEKVITKEERTIDTLIAHGKAVYKALIETEKTISSTTGLPEELFVIHSEDLLQLYPEMSPKEREYAITKDKGAVLLIGIGGKLSSGEPHDLRAPDYDDWSTMVNGKPGLNADIIVWDAQRMDSLEISSMGIRVDETALTKQLSETGKTERVSLPFHKDLLEGKLPYTIGGGIGQSRVAMLLSEKADIKEVQPIFYHQ